MSLITRVFTHFCLVSILLMAIISCNSGTWEDDDDNWKRAFNGDPPTNIKIRHSWYWRSPHFTLEQQYFFELEYSDTLAAGYSKAPDLVKLDPAEYGKIQFFNDKPKWFVPKSYDQYDIYVSKDFENYFLFIDKDKKSIFFTEYQV